MAVLYVKNRRGIEEEIGRTEVIMNSLNPVWVTKFNVIYQFETVQNLVFRIYDIDSKYHNTPVKMLNLNEQDFLGEASCALSEIITRQNQTITLGLQSKLSSSRLQLGTITIRAEETVASKKVVKMTFRCSQLKNADIFSKSDPFLRISRIVETGGCVPICKTEVINDNLNPVWKPVTLTTQQYGSKDTPLLIECFDFDNNGNHTFLGKFQGSVMGFQKLNQERTGGNLYVESSFNHQLKKTLKAQFFVDNFCEEIQYSFLDYISSGFELNFMVAVDFTASNGNPQSPQSLHYIDPRGCLNSYQQAISGVGEVIQFYDSDKLFPAWGFGGKLNDGSVSHCFNLNGSLDRCEVVGVEGIMAAYSTALHTVSLHGPTLFGPVINRAANIASESLNHNQNKYFILLIITDGVINDFRETKDALVRASSLPLSILIVGVGGADFKEMQILDADNGQRLESSSGQIAVRDIVQFVPMRELWGEISITQALLEELPAQFLSYMKLRNIKPLFAQHGLTPY
ncbi:protein BONZAI 3 [Asparagus officinalis]|nr:protein BONZAI 3 [Asparagus officinalis]